MELNKIISKNMPVIFGVLAACAILGALALAVAHDSSNRTQLAEQFPKASHCTVFDSNLEVIVLSNNERDIHVVFVESGIQDWISPELIKNCKKKNVK